MIDRSSILVRSCQRGIAKVMVLFMCCGWKNVLEERSVKRTIRRKGILEVADDRGFLVD